MIVLDIVQVKEYGDVNSNFKKNNDVKNYI